MIKPGEVKVMKKKLNAVKITEFVGMCILAFIFIMPFFWTVITSLKAPNEILTWPPTFFPEKPIFKNYTDVIKKINIFRMFGNSIYIALVTTVGQVFFCSLAGYAFAKLDFRGRELLFKIYLSTMMVPGMILLIPRYVIMRELGWVDKHASVILPFIFGNAFGVFLMRQFYMTLPGQLKEAAIIDGASQPQIFIRVYMPLTKAIVSTLFVFSFMGSWNDFLWPLITLQSAKLKTLPIGLASFQSLYGVQYNLLMAGAVLSVLPVMLAFLLAQKQFIEGIALSGVKG